MGILFILLQLGLAQADLKSDVDSAVRVFLKSSGATAASVAIYSKDDWKLEQSYGIAKSNSKYDLASLTKPFATTYVTLWMIENHLAESNELVSKALPEISQCKWAYDRFPIHAEKLKWKKPPEINYEICSKKSQMTVDQLLRHRSGLWDKVPLEAVTIAAPETGVDPTTLFSESAIMTEPGTQFHYADINFIVLQKWIDEKLKPLGKSFQEVLHETLFRQFTLVDTGLFSDLSRHLVSTFIPTRRDVSPGFVHDPFSAALSQNGDGHAGLFSSLNDLKKMATFWMNVSSETYLSSTQSPEHLLPGEKRGLGWDIDSAPYSEFVRGPIEGGFGHTGYTGQSVWIEPKTKTIALVLTNRTYLSEDKKTVEATNELRKKVATLAWELSTSTSR